MSSAGAELAELSEAALLGALLWNPRRLRDVSWLEPTDFSVPAHQAIYQTLIGLASDAIPIDLLKLPAVLAAGDYHDLRVPNAPNGSAQGPLSANALAQLLSMTPASPTRTEHSEHRAYAAIVLEASIRRQVLAAGTRIEQTDHAYLDNDLDDAFAAIDRVLQHTTTRLQDLTRRVWESAQSTSPIAAALNPDPETSTPAPPRTAQTHPPTPGAPLSSAGLRRAEHALIGACLTQPRLRELACQRLRAEDFTHSEVAATWLALGELTNSGAPVDFVLLAARVQRHGPHRDYGHGIRPSELAVLARRSDVVSGSRAVTEVSRAALSRAIAATHQALLGAGHDPHHNGEQVLHAARAALARIEHIRVRLGGHPRPVPAAAMPTLAGATTSPAPSPATPPRPRPAAIARTAALLPVATRAAARQPGRSR